jgi:hypothetical protein
MAYTDIDKSDEYFNTKLYTGNGGTQSITGLDFQPDWVWLKDRDNANSHKLYDGVRGTTKFLSSEDTTLEGTQANGLTSFDSDGFTLGSYAGTNGSGGGSGPSFVSWNWLASNTTASNTSGSITSTVSASTTSGFSIVGYTGTGANATVGHGLGVKPDMIINKTRDSTAQMWSVYHSSRGATKHLGLDRTNAEDTGSAYYQDTEPTSSVFSVGSEAATNYSSAALIAYCFAEKKGFSKFGSYTGNGSADGTFVYTGFKPAFLIVKRYDSTNNWYMYNNKVNPFNETDRPLKADTSETEATIFGGNELDFLSNGFKLRDTINGANGSGGSYIYMAFAENPFVTSHQFLVRLDDYGIY